MERETSKEMDREKETEQKRERESERVRKREREKDKEKRKEIAGAERGIKREKDCSAGLGCAVLTAGRKSHYW